MDEKRFVKLLWAAKACLLAVLIYAGYEVATSRLHLGVLDPGAARGEPHAVAQEVPPPPARAFSDYSAIVESDLFRTGNDPNASPANVQRPAASGSAPEVELGLRLVGALAGGPVASRALIQDVKTGATGSYRIGASVASATVQAIERDAVLLRYRGRLLALKLQAGAATQKPSPVSAPGTPQRDAPAAVENPPLVAKTPTQTRPSYPPDYFGDLLRRTTIEPYVRNNRTEGLKISGLEDLPLAQVLGLRNGDVVQTINGQQLTSKQKAFQVLQKAKSQSKVNLRLLRDGKSRDLSFNL